MHSSGTRKAASFFEPGKLHTLNHTGTYFSVKGPLNIARSRQGHPVVFQAGSSEGGRELAGKAADAVYTAHETLEEAQSFYRDVKQRAVRYGRSPEDVLIFPGITVIVGETDEEAERIYEEVAALVSIESALNYLGRYFEHHDFSQYPLDEPFPDLGELGHNSFQSTTELIKRTAREEKLTLRQAALRAVTPRSPFIGSAEKVADLIQEWFEGEGADGFVIRQGAPDALHHFVDLVVPVLQKRGLFRTEYERDTLRGNLGLNVPVSRYTIDNSNNLQLQGEG